VANSCLTGSTPSLRRAFQIAIVGDTRSSGAPMVLQFSHPAATGTLTGPTARHLPPTVVVAYPSGYHPSLSWNRTLNVVVPLGSE
jgi:hypothetical protein